MSLGHILYQFIIGPLEVIFEAVYYYADLFLEHAGWAIASLSLAINLLLLPLYMRADKIQAEERAAEKKMEKWVAHIKKTFKGDERFMMLQTYYRQNGYKPIYSLKGSLPLLLEIPFFIAAYHFLSNLDALKGASFGPIADLSRPDGLLTVGSLTVHVLPVLMTLINLISAAVYTKGAPLKDKLQTLILALAFLVLLYPSPSGLVLYWTLNNVFSLGKNIVLALLARRKKEAVPKAVPERSKNAGRLFTAGCAALTVLTGLLIPSAVVNSSPEEFVLMSDFYSPLRHVGNAFLLAAGLFLLWFGIFYSVSAPRARRVWEGFVLVLAVTGTVNYMFFGTRLGTLSSALKFDDGFMFPDRDGFINLGILLAVSALLIFLLIKKRLLMQGLLIILCLSLAGMAGVNLVKTGRQVPEIRRSVEKANNEQAHFTLSRGGKNVVVLMLDRAISAYLPYLFQEMPQLEKQFDGFTYYPNTLSFGPYTNFGAPALYGGYEYTPEEMNKRDKELLADKHNEALLLMPRLFDSAGYEVTVCDPTYAGYKEIPDLSVFDPYPSIRRYITELGQFAVYSDTERTNALWETVFFRYSLMKILPYGLQPEIYQEGSYFSTDIAQQMTQKEEGLSQAVGMREKAVNSWSVLKALPSITNISEGSENTFLMMSNSLTHEPMLMQEPEYVPSQIVDNREYDRQHEGRFSVNGRTMRVENVNQMKHYQVNMAAMLLLGKWFDSLRAAGVYDSTRIIIAADHGRNLHQFDDWIFGPEKGDDIMYFNPLMLVKDFDAHGFRTDRQFMTNADVPTLAFSGLIGDPVNPFTGQPVTAEAKNAPEQHVIASEVFQISANNGTTFWRAPWYAVRDDIFNTDNWKPLGKH